MQSTILQNRIVQLSIYIRLSEMEADALENAINKTMTSAPKTLLPAGYLAGTAAALAQVLMSDKLAKPLSTGPVLTAHVSPRLSAFASPCTPASLLVCTQQLRKHFYTIFGRPFVKRFALCYRTVVCLSCPVCNVGALWTNGWMDQDATCFAGRPRSRPHCVRWGPSSPHGKACDIILLRAL